MYLECAHCPAWLFNVYVDGVRFLEEGREGRLPCLLYSDDLVLCGESEEDSRAMVRWFVEVCRKGLKVNACKRNVIVLNGV